MFFFPLFHNLLLLRCVQRFFVIPLEAHSEKLSRASATFMSSFLTTPFVILNRGKETGEREGRNKTRHGDEVVRARTAEGMEKACSLRPI